MTAMIGDKRRNFELEMMFRSDWSKRLSIDYVRDHHITFVDDVQHKLSGSVSSSILCVCHGHQSLAFVRRWSHRFQNIASTAIRFASKQTLSYLFLLAKCTQRDLSCDNIQSKCACYLRYWHRRRAYQFNPCWTLDD